MSVENRGVHLPDIGLSRLDGISFSHDVLRSTENVSEYAGGFLSERNAIKLTQQTVEARSGGTRCDWRHLAARLGSQGSMTSVSESEDDEEQYRELGGVPSLELAFTPSAQHPRCSTPSSTSHRAVTRLGGADAGTDAVTPTKALQGTADPLTPTSNLKMLSCVASPEIRQRDEMRALDEVFAEAPGPAGVAVDILPAVTIASQPTAAEQQSECQQAVGLKADVPSHPADHQQQQQQTTTLSNMPCTNFDDILLPTISRKEKSLGLLCQRFLARYPEYPEPFDNLEICLDEVAKDLSVERRRIYDIVNVLESVEIVSRLAKNKYMWHGKSRLSDTLSKLKALAKLEGFAEQIEKVKDFEVSRDLEAGLANRGKKVKKTGDVCTKVPAAHPNSLQENILSDTMRKEKSLGIMSQKFLMLFLVSLPKTVNLDISAKILIGNPDVDRTENGKFKTKIRRLYDIANILTSLDLIRKVHVTEIRGRKPAFKYVGPDVYDMNNVEVCSCDVGYRPSTKHSLLDCIQDSSDCNLLHTCTTAKSPDSDNLQITADKPRCRTGLTRHASFEQICEVAEQERKRLYFESRSQPTSPTSKRKSLPAQATALSTSEAAAPSQPSASGSLKHLMLIRDSKTAAYSQAASCVLPDAGRLKPARASAPPLTTIHKIPLEQMSTLLATSLQRSKARPAAQSAPPGEAGRRAATVVTLTREQLDALIRSISSGGGGGERRPAVVQAQAGGSACYVDAATQSSPQFTSALLSLTKSVGVAPVTQTATGERKRSGACDELGGEKRVKCAVNMAGVSALVAWPDVEVAHLTQLAEQEACAMPAESAMQCVQVHGVAAGVLPVSQHGGDCMLSDVANSVLSTQIDLCQLAAHSESPSSPFYLASPASDRLPVAGHYTPHTLVSAPAACLVPALLTPTTVTPSASLNVLPYYWSAESVGGESVVTPVSGHVVAADHLPVSISACLPAGDTWCRPQLTTPGSFFRNTPCALPSQVHCSVPTTFDPVISNTVVSCTGVPRRLSMGANLL